MQSAQLKVMVIEDETLLLQAITKKLKIHGMDVLSCTDGNQALDYLKNMDILPDVIWLDYYLKNMDGLQFMTQLKKNDAWSKIPVLVVSNSAGGEKVQHLLALGVRKYLLKAEYRLDEIVSIIKEITSQDSKDQDAG